MFNFRENQLIRAIRLWITPHDMCESIQPLLIVFLVQGSMPFCLVGPRGAKQLKPSTIGFLLTIANILLFIVSYWKTIGLPKILIAHFVFNRFSTFIDTFMITSALVAVLSMLLGCLIQRHRFAAILNLMSSIDKQLTGLNGRLRHGATLWVLCCRMVFSILWYFPYLILAIVLSVGYDESEPNIYAFISYFMPHLKMLGFLLKWRTVIYLLNRRFQVLNEILAKLHQNTNLQIDRSTVNARRGEDVDNKNIPDRNRTSVAKQEKAKNIVKKNDQTNVSPMELDQNYVLDSIVAACRIHEDLCDACYLTEQYFSMMMLTIVTIAFLIIVINAYFAVDMIVIFVTPTSSVQQFWKNLWMYLGYQLFIHGLALSYIVRNTSAVLFENEKCSIHVLKLMNRVRTQAAFQKLLEFSQQLLNRNVRFTAMSLFTLEKSLILTMVAATSTYLIILVEFKRQRLIPSSNATYVLQNIKHTFYMSYADHLNK